MRLYDYTGMRSGAVILWQAYGFMILAQCERRNGEKLPTKYQQPQMTVLVLFFIENRLQTEEIAHFFAYKIVGTGYALSLLENDVWDVVSLQTTYLQR